MPPKKVKASDIMKDIGLESSESGTEEDSYEYETESESENWSDDSSEEIVSKNKKTSSFKENMAGEEIDYNDLKGKDVIKQMLKPVVTKKTTTTTPVKKGPGRPRKTPILPDIPRLGIVAKALHKKNKMEMQYDSPQSIKKIFALLKSMNCKEIYITFHTKGFLIQAIDHLEKSNISVECQGERFNRYFCEKKYTVKIQQVVLSSLFDQLTTNIHELKFISKKKESKDTHIFIMFVNRVLESDSLYEIPVTWVDKVPDAMNQKPVRYPLRFSLSSREFKTIVKNMERCKADKFLIHKNGKEDLRIMHSRKNRDSSTIGYRQQFKNADKINLYSELSAKEIFTVPISVKYIKKFANSTLADDVEIHAHAKEPTLFISELDKDDVEINGKKKKMATFILKVRTSTFEYQAIK